MALTQVAPMRSPPPLVRCAMPGEGIAIAALWRELWDTHQAWGGYPGSRDDEVYAQLATRLDDEAYVRDGRLVLGSHAHLVAELDGAPAGQVEGWLERRGPGLFAPLICEVRSLVVTERARGFGVGRALLDTLTATSHAVAPEVGCVLAAEVLEPNPAHAFYARVGFSPVAWNAAIDPGKGGRAEVSNPAGLIARSAGPLDASAVARLEGTLAARRRAAGDLRFGPPPAVDSALLSIVASHLAADAREQGDSATIVVVDRTGIVRGAASVILQLLDPPFLAVRRALVGRFALDSSFAPAALVAPLVAMGCRFAEARGAIRVELTDLTAPGTALHDAALATGALPWSRVVLRESPATGIAGSLPAPATGLGSPA